MPYFDKSIFVSRLALILTIFLSGCCAFLIVSILKESLIIRRRFGRIPITLRLMIACYRLVGYRRMFYIMCLLTVVIAMPKAFTDPTLPREQKAFVLALAVLSILTLFRDTLIPQIVVLGVSNNKNVDYFCQLRYLLKPSRTTCLLTARGGLTFPQAVRLAIYGLRLADSPHWRLVTMHLVDFAPVIIFVGEKDTTQVEEEYTYMVENAYTEKCFLATGNNPGQDAKKIKTMLQNADKQSIARGHKKAWKWIKAAPLLHVLGMKNGERTLSDGRRIMLKVLQEASSKFGFTIETFFQSLTDFPEFVDKDILGSDANNRGAWMVRGIFRGVIEGEERRSRLRLQFQAIAHSMLARLELLLKNYYCSDSHAREALRIIESQIPVAGGYAACSDIELAELGSLYFTMAESSAYRYLHKHHKGDFETAFREYKRAIEQYSTLNVRTDIIKIRMNKLAKH
jgi:hypothetical protein